MKNITNELLVNCIDKKLFEKEGMGYMEGNTELAIYVLVMLDLIQLNIGSKLKLNMSVLDNSVRNHNNRTFVAVAISEEVYMATYGRIKAETIMSLNTDRTVFPSHYMLTNIYHYSMKNVMVGC